jgi:hypothetical protein
MIPEHNPSAAHATATLWTARDVAAILSERGWLVADAQIDGQASKEASEIEDELVTWLTDAAALLGPHAASRAALEDLLGLIVRYDARVILESPESHAVMARGGARTVIRELAGLVLDGPEIGSDRFKEIVTRMIEALGFRGRGLFHPIRLALAGRAGEGELDRVILLLDRAAKLNFRVPVKGTRQRMLEFCAALD